MDKQRKCVGCAKFKPKDTLIKITKNHENGQLVINPDSKIFGRSAYLCYNQSCIELALKKSKLNKALKTSVALEKAVLFDILQKEK